MRLWSLIGFWQLRYFIISSEGIVYAYDNTSKEARENLLFDHNFKLTYKKSETKVKRGIIIYSTTRKLFI